MVASWLDFWTTNSTIWYNNWTQSKLINLSKWKQETRTVLLADLEENEFVIWNAAIKRYIEWSVWRLIQSPKSFLNSREGIKTTMLWKILTLTDIVSKIIWDFKEKLEEAIGNNVDSVLIWRPVNFHDDDKELDRLAQKRLEEAASLAWFKNIDFQFEPLAAAKTYQSILQKWQEEKVVIADLWWWTSDFSLLHMTSNTMQVLWNNWVYIGGNNFDRRLSYDFFSPYLWRWTLFNSMWKQLEMPTDYYNILSDWRKLHELWDRKTKQDILWLYWPSLEKDKFWRLCDIVNNPLLCLDYPSFS